MAKQRRSKQTTQNATQATKPATKIDFSFSEPEEIASSFIDYLQCADNGTYIEPPISQNDLYELLTAGLYHASAIQAKVNILVSTFKPTQYVKLKDFKKICNAFLVLGNAYCEIRRNVLGDIIGLESLPSMHMRRMSNRKDFIMLNWPRDKSKVYKAKDVLHLIEPDLKQELYGLPTYLSAIHSIKLNESATLFRRRYYENGSHAGFILYGTDAGIDVDDWENLKDELRRTRGSGAFKNLLLRSPNGKPDGLQLIPISEVAAKDEFTSIKNASRDDMLGIHRVPAPLMGIIPEKSGSLGDSAKAAAVFNANEVRPIQAQLLEINEILGIEALDFVPYVISEVPPEATPK